MNTRSLQAMPMRRLAKILQRHYEADELEMKEPWAGIRSNRLFLEPQLQCSEYNRDQLNSVLSILEVFASLTEEEAGGLRARIKPYLAFREDISEFYRSLFRDTCRELCFDTGLSACCGFESIITFFADHVISLLESSQQQIEALVTTLRRPNLTQRCLFLGPSGCMWTIPPISCAMFLCSQVKERVFDARPDARRIWSELQGSEKEYTYPNKPVLFDELETFFMKRGCESPHLYFHRSPGLLRIKSKAGLRG
jgi:hypothetical protein